MKSGIQALKYGGVGQRARVVMNALRIISNRDCKNYNGYTFWDKIQQNPQI